METKHTPAPWYTDGLYIKWRPLPGGPGVMVARVAGTEGDEVDANSRLIAAAPDLLEAAQAMIARWPTDQHDASPLYDEANAIRAAIAKATGASS